MKDVGGTVLREMIKGHSYPHSLFLVFFSCSLRLYWEIEPAQGGFDIAAMAIHYTPFDGTVESDSDFVHLNQVHWPTHTEPIGFVNDVVNWRSPSFIATPGSSAGSHDDGGTDNDEGSSSRVHDITLPSAAMAARTAAEALPDTHGSSVAPMAPANGSVAPGPVRLSRVPTTLEDAISGGSLTIRDSIELNKRRLNVSNVPQSSPQNFPHREGRKKLHSGCTPMGRVEKCKGATAMGYGCCSSPFSTPSTMPLSSRGRSSDALNCVQPYPTLGRQTLTEPRTLRRSRGSISVTHMRDSNIMDTATSSKLYSDRGDNGNCHHLVVRAGVSVVVRTIRRINQAVVRIIRRDKSNSHHPRQERMGGSILKQRRSSLAKKKSKDKGKDKDKAVESIDPLFVVDPAPAPAPATMPGSSSSRKVKGKGKSNAHSSFGGVATSDGSLTPRAAPTLFDFEKVQLPPWPHEQSIITTKEEKDKAERDVAVVASTAMADPSHQAAAFHEKEEDDTNVSAGTSQVGSGAATRASSSGPRVLMAVRRYADKVFFAAGNRLLFIQ
jgi:hypothetical protein